MDGYNTMNMIPLAHYYNFQSCGVIDPYNRTNGEVQRAICQMCSAVHRAEPKPDTYFKRMKKSALPPGFSPAVTARNSKWYQ